MTVHRYKQFGLTLVELMVSLVISNVLIIGITQVYISNKRSYIFQQSQSANIENSRFAVLMLNELLSKAGYRRAPSQSMADAFPESKALNSHCEMFAEQSVITQLKGGADSQQTGFCLRYQPAYNGELVCDGSAAPLLEPTPFVYPSLNETVYIAIQFDPDITQANKGAINCTTAHGKMQLLEGIADLRVEFGSGLPNEKKLQSAAFKSAAAWHASDGLIRAVRYSLLSVSMDNQRDGDSVVYQRWLDAASTAEQARLQAQDKKQIYQVAAGAQALRNMMP